MISNPIKTLSTILSTIVVLVVLYGVIKVTSYFSTEEVVDTHQEVVDNYREVLEQLNEESVKAVEDAIKYRPITTFEYCTECNVSIIY